MKRKRGNFANGCTRTKACDSDETDSGLDIDATKSCLKAFLLLGKKDQI